MLAFSWGTGVGILSVQFEWLSRQKKSRMFTLTLTTRTLCTMRALSHHVRRPLLWDWSYPKPDFLCSVPPPHWWTMTADCTEQEERSGAWGSRCSLCAHSSLHSGRQQGWGRTDCRDEMQSDVCRLWWARVRLCVCGCLRREVGWGGGKQVQVLYKVHRVIGVSSCRSCMVCKELSKGVDPFLCI